MQPDNFEGIETLSEIRHRSMTMMLTAMLAGGLGVGLRYGINALVTTHMGDAFPWGTLLINISGAFALGLLTAILAAHPASNIYLYPALGIGLLGGFTTYSAFALETVALAESGAIGRTVLYMAATNILGVGGCIVGIVIVRIIN